MALYCVLWVYADVCSGVVFVVVCMLSIRLHGGVVNDDNPRIPDTARPTEPCCDPPILLNHGALHRGLLTN